MKIIDTNNTPEEILYILTHDDYDHEKAKGTLTTTTFAKPVREIVLTERHYSEIETEAEDCLWRVLGSGVHKVLEESMESRKTDEFVQTEERLIHTLLGQEISGKFDLVRNNKMCDYKVTSAWKVYWKRAKGEQFDDWVQQGSINRYLYFKTYKRMLDDKARYIVIYRDWNKKDVKTHYPEKPFECIDIDLMSIADTEYMLKDKILKIQEARKLEDDALPHCTDEERWQNYNRKLNKKVYNKCEKYCNAYKFCLQANNK